MSSPFTFIRRLLALVAACGLVAASGANAQTVIEKLVTPGPLSEVHRELDAKCNSCHAAFEKGDQARLCLACHEDVAADIRLLEGFHGKSPAVGSAACKTCHTEHEGASFNIAPFDHASFSHKLTDYVLRGAHEKAECAQCHLPGKKFRDAPSGCVDCHKNDEPHMGRLGTDCASCHNETDWVEISFNHEKTKFPLFGAHADVACGECHLDETYQGLPSDCIDCHRDDDVHKGAFGEACASCHGPAAWTEIKFDHGGRTRFSLTGKHAALECAACHTQSLTTPKLQTSCNSCHKADDVHKGRNGSDCASCHNTQDWTGVRFDHNTQTKFALRGAHKSVTCEGCHTQAVTKALPGSLCIDCHREDDPHKGGLGENCSSCHNEASWIKQTSFDHDLTSFPLLGAHRKAECESCHATREFSETSSDCISCHAEDDRHEGALGPDCGECHNPNSWPLWIFDHSAQTSFPLTGRHEGLGCSACHRTAARDGIDQSASCISCHRADDKHRGEFGSNCERCHTTTSFREIRFP